MSFCCWNFGCCYLPDSTLRDKVAIVTGGTAGIGYYVAKSLAKQGMQVIIIGRNSDIGLASARAISSSCHVHHPVQYHSVDLKSLASVRQFIAQFRAQHSALHLLVLNAGIMACPYEKTSDGFESQFQVNHLSQFLLAVSLLDVMKASAPARVVTVSSIAHANSGVGLDALPSYSDGQGYSDWGAYGRTKAWNVMFAYELQRRLRGTGVTANTVHPGVIRTSLWKHQGGMERLLCKCAPDGARTVLHAATNDDSGGRYYVPWCCCTCKAASSDATYDRQIAQELWRLSARWCELPSSDEADVVSEKDVVMTSGTATVTSTSGAAATTVSLMGKDDGQGDSAIVKPNCWMKTLALCVQIPCFFCCCC